MRRRFFLNFGLGDYDWSRIGSLQVILIKRFCVRCMLPHKPQQASEKKNKIGSKAKKRFLDLGTWLQLCADTVDGVFAISHQLGVCTLQPLHITYNLQNFISSLLVALRNKKNKFASCRSVTSRDKLPSADLQAHYCSISFYILQPTCRRGSFCSSELTGWVETHVCLCSLI